MNFIKKIKKIFAERPTNSQADFARLSGQKKVEWLEREAGIFVKKYGEVIKKLAHE